MPQPDTKQRIEQFNALDDWDARFNYLIALGRNMPTLSQDQRREKYLLQGCLSQAWLKTDITPDNPPRMHLLAATDSQLVAGLIAIIRITYHRKTLRQVLETDITRVLRQMNLQHHLSPTRRNSLHAIVAHIHSAARHALRENGEQAA